ncbi:MAG: DUF1841 family protein [Gammaproteobacteria bacterium]|jgi:hypothetical protein
MLFGQDRHQLRRTYCQAWAARRQGRPLEPLQAQIVAVVEQHPEYQRLLEDPDRSMSMEYSPESGETNPFLHMGMHLAIREQVDTDRPRGMRELYRRLLGSVGDAHALEHRLMECLAEALWQAQREGRAPDESRYLACVRTLAGGR